MKHRVTRPDKNIPQPVGFDRMREKYSDRIFVLYWCPVCNNRVVYDYNKDRCKMCGQKLDWS